jgi:hypothetical protein
LVLILKGCFWWAGFLIFSYFWGMDSKVGDYEVFSVDKIDKTKSPSITLKPMDLGKVCF